MLIFVTETFTREQRVKSDGGHDDEYPVMKLNEVRDFQTGIYDYNVMTSSFVPLDGSAPRGLTTKTSMSSQEWCGHTYEQLIRRDGTYDHTGHSYFDGEGDKQRDIAIPEGAISADALPMLVRGVAGQLLEPGEAIERPVVDKLMDARFAHEPVRFRTAKLSRSEDTTEMAAPAGSFEVFTVEVDVEGGPTTRYFVGEEHPHHLVGWTRGDGEEAWLTGSVRNKYWSLNANGGEAALGELGLEAPHDSRQEAPR